LNVCLIQHRKWAKNNNPMVNRTTTMTKNNSKKSMVTPMIISNGWNRKRKKYDYICHGRHTCAFKWFSRNYSMMKPMEMHRCKKIFRMMINSMIRVVQVMMMPTMIVFVYWENKVFLLMDMSSAFCLLARYWKKIEENTWKTASNKRTFTTRITHEHAATRNNTISKRTRSD
jgi:hypothetical protein